MEEHTGFRTEDSGFWKLMALCGKVLKPPQHFVWSYRGLRPTEARPRQAAAWLGKCVSCTGWQAACLPLGVLRCAGLAPDAVRLCDLHRPLLSKPGHHSAVLGSQTSGQSGLQQFAL